MTTAAIVVRWKGGREVERCLRSLVSSEPIRPTEIILVDAGSDDGGAQLLAQAFPEIQVEALSENPGFAAAANHGVSVSTAENIFLLNPDTEIMRSALAFLTNFLEKQPDLAGVVPLLENTDGTSQYRWQLKELPTVRDLGRGRSGRPEFGSIPQHSVAVAQPAAAAWLVRKSVWEALGGLEQSFFPAWWEDVDFCARLQEWVKDPACPWNTGWRVEPQARVRHTGGSSLGSLGKSAFLEAFYGNLLRYAKRRHPVDLSDIRKRLRRNLLIRAILNPSRCGDYRRVRRGLCDTRVPEAADQNQE